MKFRNLMFLGFLLVLVMFIFVAVVSSGCSSASTAGRPVVTVRDSEPKDKNAWIRYVRDGNVNVQIVGEKTFITFRPPEGDLNRFSIRINYLVPVRFECSKVKKGGECDLSKPYKLYVSRMSVEPVLVEGPVRME